MKSRLALLTCFLLVLSAKAQEETVWIHIELIDGRTGSPMKDQEVGLEDGAGYRDISVRTDDLGIASLKISRNTIILTHNTDNYVNCGDEGGGLVHNDFKVGQILFTGIVQPIEQPNICKKTSAVAKPGELVLFVRPWRWGEKI